MLVDEVDGELATATEGSDENQPQDGWIWRSRRRPSNWVFEDDAEMEEVGEDEWQGEANRVHWFRAEAEFLRWLEQHERKHFEFIRLLRSFQWSIDLWRSRSEVCGSDTGLGAFASRQSAVYSSMRSDALKLFREVADIELIPRDVDVDKLGHEGLVQSCLTRRQLLIGIAYCSTESTTSSD